MADCIVMAPGLDGSVKALLSDFPPAPRPTIEAALKAVADYPAQVLLLPPEHV